MSHATLPPSTFRLNATDRNIGRNTVIEDVPQISIRRAPPEKLEPRPNVISPLSDDFPTPKAISIHIPVVEDVPASPASSDTQSDHSSLWSKRSSRSAFDEMYDITESESEGDVPIKLSSSVKKRMAMAKNNGLPVVIPSPSEWPTIEKLQSVTPISPGFKVGVPRSVISQLRSLRVPSSSSTPSLDGSISSEELVSSSCPSTPDIAQQVDANEAWEAPIQLDPRSISLLEHFHIDDQQDTQQTVIEVPLEAIEEMKQIVESPPVTGSMRIETQELEPSDPSGRDDELSALSVPSPGGFFASLNSSIARHTWYGTDSAPTTSTATEFYGLPFGRKSSRSSALTTSTATSFYNVPWTDRPDNPVEHSISLGSPRSEQDPITAKKIMFSPSDIIPEVDEMDETYDNTLKETAAVNLDRTQLWLSAQTDYMKAICEDSDVTDTFKDVEDATPKTPEQIWPLSADGSPSKKSVRFADVAVDQASGPSDVQKKRVSPIHDGTFWEGWRHHKRSQRARDVFQHRQARAEAEHVKRTSCQRQHVEQLQGKYEINATERPAPPRPISTFLPQTTDDEKKAIIQRAECERQALEQLHPSSWHLSAQKEINGGRLLTSPIVQSFKGRKDVKILDMAGQVHCSWAWHVALDHPEAEVHTVVSSDAEAHVAGATLEGPSNHYVDAAPKLWELPFEQNSFDVVSARNLYAFLKTTWPKGQAADEWDLTLRECLRVLKPGGYLEFDLLDAELIHADSACQALGVEFAFNLKTRGYDSTSGRNFLPRLKRAGFDGIKRAWILLPVADVVPRWTDSGRSTASPDSTTERSIGPNGEVEDYEAPVMGSTKDVRAMTGLVGARMWEQWMLKLNGEMGRSEERCLEGVAEALEEGGKGDASWRCLVGWARKGI